jgi:hypothetical protein
MKHAGFPGAWLDWLPVLLSTANTRVLLNGSPGRRICHARGLRQGDPLSPMLFLFVMEVLNALIKKADKWNLLQGLGMNLVPFRNAMYANDLIMFASPTVSHMSMVRTIFLIFEGASGLSCNMTKCQLVPIQCSEDQIQAALSSFPCQRADFPITYLGMPLSVYKLPRYALQPIADKMAGKLPAWKGKLLHRSGRLTLVKTTQSLLYAYHFYSLIVFFGTICMLVLNSHRVFLLCCGRGMQNSVVHSSPLVKEEDEGTRTGPVCFLSIIEYPLLCGLLLSDTSSTVDEHKVRKSPETLDE